MTSLFDDLEPVLSPKAKRAAARQKEARAARAAAAQAQARTPPASPPGTAPAPAHATPDLFAADGAFAMPTAWDAPAADEPAAPPADAPAGPAPHPVDEPAPPAAPPADEPAPHPADAPAAPAADEPAPHPAPAADELASPAAEQPPRPADEPAPHVAPAAEQPPHPADEPAPAAEQPSHPADEPAAPAAEQPPHPADDPFAMPTAWDSTADEPAPPAAPPAEQPPHPVDDPFAMPTAWDSADDPSAHGADEPAAIEDTPADDAPAAIAFDPFEPLSAGVTLVEASAGTGKTYSLTASVVWQVVGQGVKLSEVLVVTFTRAATEELKSRIRDRMQQVASMLGLSADAAAPMAAADPFLRELNTRLTGEVRTTAKTRAQTALLGFDEARIFTIHSFCQRLLSENAVAVGTPLQSELLEASDGLFLDAARDAWSKTTYALPSTLLDALLQTAPGKSPDDLARAVKAAFAAHKARVKSGEHTAPARVSMWEENDEPDADEDPLDSSALGPTGQPSMPAAIEPKRRVTHAVPPSMGKLEMAVERARLLLRKEWQASADGLVAALTSGPLNRNSYKPEQVRKSMDAWRSRLSRRAHAEPRDGALLRLTSAAIERATKRGHTPPRHPIVARIDRLCAAEDALAAEVSGWVAETEIAMVQDGLWRVMQRLKKDAQLTFDGLLHTVLDALGDDSRRHVLISGARAQYKLAFIDEFQDTDHEQVRIFTQLFLPSRPLVLIGDPKQAIYRFRGADIEAYLSAAARAGSRRRHLPTNHRSTAGLIGATNAFFARAERPFMDTRIAFRPVGASGRHTALARHGAQVPPVQFWVLPSQTGTTRAASRQRGMHRRQTESVPSKTLRGEPAATPDMTYVEARSACAKAAARLVTTMLDGTYDHGGTPLTAGDFAVLVRSNRMGKAVLSALAARGLSGVFSGDQPLFTSPSGQALRHVLAAMLEPHRTDKVAAAMASGFFGHAAEDLVNDDVLNAQVEHFSAWNAVWTSRGIHAALSALRADQDLHAGLHSRVDGPRWLTDFAHLGEILHATERKERFGPRALYAWLDVRVRGGTDAKTESLRLEDDRDVVRVSTVHQSKGLEYPVVILADPLLWSSRKPDADVPLALRDHAENDMHRPAGADGATVVLHPTELQRLATQEADDAESRRLLYVALTRAKLCTHILWPHMKDAGKSALHGLLSTRSRYAGDDAVKALDAACTALDAARQGSAAGRRAFGGADGPLFAVDHAENLAAPAPNAQAAEDRPQATDDRAAETGAPAPHASDASDASDASGALMPPATLSRRWATFRVGSFSALTDRAHNAPGAGHVSAAQDGLDLDGGALLPDALGLKSATEAPAPTARPVTLQSLKPGPKTGLLLHAILEFMDFRDPLGPESEDLVKAQLEIAGYSASESSRVLPELMQACAEMVAAPMTSRPRVRAPRLSDLTPADRWNELEFLIPMKARGGLTPYALSQVFVPHISPEVPAAFVESVKNLDFERFSGFLKGFIDLVFVHGGKYYVVDYKSNHLGDTYDDYRGDALDAAMLGHHYHLQAYLYGVAVHRYLKWRLPGYSYKKHFGGVRYLFLKGMHPKARGAGIWEASPPEALIEGLSNALAGQSAHAVHDDLHTDTATASDSGEDH